VGTVLGYIIALLVVGGLLFLAASYAFGRGEEMAPALPDGTPVELPDGRLADGDDLRALRLSVVLRGYRMDEVDWLLDRLSEQVDTRDREIARLRSVLHVEPVTGPADEPELLTHPFPRVVDAVTDDREGERLQRQDDDGYDPARRRTRPRPTGEEWSGPAGEWSGPAGERSGTAGERSGPAGERSGPGTDRYGPGEDRPGPDGEHTGPRPVPDDLRGDTGARPDEPVRQIRRHEPE
jgi:DivIVA domain-containing protein